MTLFLDVLQNEVAYIGVWQPICKLSPNFYQIGPKFWHLRAGRAKEQGAVSAGSIQYLQMKKFELTYGEQRDIIYERPFKGLPAKVFVGNKKIARGGAVR